MAGCEQSDTHPLLAQLHRAPAKNGPAVRLAELDICATPLTAPTLVGSAELLTMMMLGVKRHCMTTTREAISVSSSIHTRTVRSSRATRVSSGNMATTGVMHRLATRQMVTGLANLAICGKMIN